MRPRSILLVDDEPLVRECTELVLTMHGCKVDCVDNGLMALDLVRSVGTEPDLLITDISLPVISGPQLALKLREKYPNVKVLFISGFSEENLDVPIQLDMNTAFLQKPFSPHKLIETIEQLLG